MRVQSITIRITKLFIVNILQFCLAYFFSYLPQVWLSICPPPSLLVPHGLSRLLTTQTLFFYPRSLEPPLFSFYLHRLRFLTPSRLLCLDLTLFLKNEYPRRMFPKRQAGGCIDTAIT